MPYRDSATRASLLLIHDDSDLLDALTRIFEARGHEVAIAATQFSALSRLDSAHNFHAVIAGWDALQGIGRTAYQWVLANRYELRSRFVFVAKDAAADFADRVGGQCLLLDSYDFEEIIRVTEVNAERALAGPSRHAGAGAALVRAVPGAPSLLLVEDDPLQLELMQSLLAESGFAVTPAESGHQAMAALKSADFDVILCDWQMPNGSGGDLYEWLLEHRPHLAPRCVFMSENHKPADFANRAGDRPFIPKGQDSPVLFARLRAIAAESRAGSMRMPAQL